MPLSSPIGNRVIIRLLLGWLAMSASATTVCAQQGNQKFDGFNLEGFTEGGQRAWVVNGATADIQGDQIKITDVDASRFGEQEVNLKAQKGTIDKTKGDILLEKDVVITAKTGEKLETESLNWEKGQDRVSTEDPVVITSDRMKATGVGLEANPGLKTAEMKKDVTVEFNIEPQKADGRIVTITSDGPMEIDQTNNLATFNKNVIAIQDNKILKADRMEIHFNPDTQKITETICIGNVVIQQEENTTYADRAVYSAAEQKLILTGKPKLIMFMEEDSNLTSFVE